MASVLNREGACDERHHPRTVHSATLSEGFVAGPPVSEAPTPWLFLTRPQKAQALEDLLQSVIARGMKEVLVAV